MEIKQLLGVFNEILNKDGVENITPETSFKNCERWDSMSAFEITEKLNSQFGIRIRGIELRRCNTIADLLELLNSK